MGDGMTREDAISRDAAIKACMGMSRYTGIDEAPYDYAESVLTQLPSVTVRQTEILDRRIDDKTVVFKTLDGKETEYVERQTGEWIEDTETYAGDHLSNYKCSLCGKIAGSWVQGLTQDKLFKFCPNCGADMRGGKHE